MIDFDCQGSMRARRRRGCGYVVNLESAESCPHIHQPALQGNARVTHFYRKGFALSAEQEKERLLGDFLEVADNLERALANADPARPEALIEGVQAIQRQFGQTLAKHGVRKFEAEGKPFDPERHEALSLLHRPDLPPNSVVHVIQPGYTIGDRVLRPARVVVNKDR